MAKKPHKNPENRPFGRFSSLKGALILDSFAALVVCGFCSSLNESATYFLNIKLLFYPKLPSYTGLFAEGV